MSNAYNEQIIEAEIAQIGPRGIPGEAATINIGTVTTGAAGTDASVTNSGTSTAAILDFVIPRGDKGETGEQGQQGIPGIQGETGNGIASIEKISTSGLVDTYRITLTNNTYYDFTVTNGSYISSIDKTSTSGLVDTYTITLTNGATHTFTVTNGAKGDKGETGDVGNGIINIMKMSTQGLTDNYRINFTNGTFFDFEVENGKGITSVTLLSWVGLDKTYRMNFNDGSYFDYIVSNGAGSQVDWGGIYGEITQQTDLQESFHALKGYSDNGTLLSNTTLYNDVLNYAHSTFDLSKFTVVGSPNITDDGVASRFSENDYINCGTIQSPAYSYEEEIRFYYSSNSEQLIRGVNQNSAIGWYLRTEGNGRYRIAISGVDSSGWQKDSGGEINNFAMQNAWNYIKFIWDGTKYELYSKTDNTEYTLIYSYISSVPLTQAVAILGNAGQWNFAKYFTGSIDLKYYSIIIDGAEVFSGNKTGVDTYTINGLTVSIPYSLSSTGSKIVDSAYRTQVESVYNAEGSALYYTIDEANKNVTLPMGEVYGFISNQGIIKKYRNGITYWNLYADGTLEIGGTCESGVEYSLPREFKDTNYILTIPYSAKTASTFTPSATGDFIAKGIGA